MLNKLDRHGVWCFAIQKHVFRRRLKVRVHTVGIRQSSRLWRAPVRSFLCIVLAWTRIWRNWIALASESPSRSALIWSEGKVEPKRSASGWLQELPEKKPVIKLPNCLWDSTPDFHSTYIVGYPRSSPYTHMKCRLSEWNLAWVSDDGVHRAILTWYPV